MTGRLDCVYDQTLTGYQPIVSIIATRIITLHGVPEQGALREGRQPPAETAVEVRPLAHYDTLIA